MLDSNLLEMPDLVFAIPLVPDGHRRARGGTATAGEVDVELGAVDEDAEGKDPSVCDPPVVTFMNLPVSAAVLFVRANVPSARAAGLDGDDLSSILQGTLDVEVALIVEALERPTVAGVLNPPLRGKVRGPD